MMLLSFLGCLGSYSFLILSICAALDNLIVRQRGSPDVFEVPFNTHKHASMQWLHLKEQQVILEFILGMMIKYIEGSVCV